MRRGSPADQQHSQRSRLIGGEPVQVLPVDGRREWDQLVAEGPRPLREVDPAQASVIRIRGTGNEFVAHHPVDGPDHGRRLDRHHPRDLRLRHSVTCPQEQEHRPLTDGDARRSDPLGELVGYQPGHPVHEIAQAVLDHERPRLGESARHPRP